MECSSPAHICVQASQNGHVWIRFQNAQLVKAQRYLYLLIGESVHVGVHLLRLQSCYM